MHKPTIHMNGTSKNALLESYLGAMEAIRDAIEAVQDTSPHGRDYYVQEDPDAFVGAVREHQARLKALQTVIGELEQLADLL